MTGWLEQKIEDGYEAVVTWVKGIAPAVLAFLKPVAQQVTTDEIAIAEASVAVGFTTPGDGAVKLLAALAYFASQSAAKEIPYVESRARTLVEIALQNAKAAATATVVDTSAPAPAQAV